MRNKILCETTLYDAGNIPYEDKNCIRVLLYENIPCMTFITCGGSSNPLQVSRGTMYDIHIRTSVPKVMTKECMTS